MVEVDGEYRRSTTCNHAEGTAEPDRPGTVSTGLVESPVRRESHAGFGERVGETDELKGSHRASARLNGG